MREGARTKGISRIEDFSLLHNYNSKAGAEARRRGGTDVTIFAAARPKAREKPFVRLAFTKHYYLAKRKLHGWAVVQGSHFPFPLSRGTSKMSRRGTGAASSEVFQKGGGTELENVA
jgi:hypothetical protein